MLVEVKDVRKFFPVPQPFLASLRRQPAPQVRAVDGVSLAIGEGETLGLVGESGSGKSTLGRVILNLHPATSGEVLFAGQPVGRWSRGGAEQFRRQAQIIFQNPYSSLNPRKTVRQILAVPLGRRGLHGAAMREKARELLERVGLGARYLDAYPHQMSGGQRQRVAVARAIAMEPRFIVADEPVSALDVSVQAQIIHLLEALRRDLGLTYLFISHDLSVVYHLCNRVAVMYLGRLVEVADTDELFRHPAHPYTQALLSAAPQLDRAARRQRILLQGSVPNPLAPPAGCHFHPRCPAERRRECGVVRPEMVEIAPGHQVACHLYG